ncbi:MAG: efflux RND transporter periplasmic adaptor subunit [Corynebacterium sp.]|nr:efflux RND transporter periplasmic adaptor subunit [Corynebacterium sp.]
MSDISTSSALDFQLPEENSGRWGWIRRYKAAVIIGALVLLTVLGLLIRSLVTAGDDAIVPAAEVIAVEPTDVTETISVTGSIQPSRTATLSTTLSSPVASLTVKAGDRVQADQLVATMDTTDLQQQRTNAAAEGAESARTAADALAEAEATFTSTQRQVADGTTPEVQAAQSTLTQAERQLDTAQRAYDTAKREAAIGTTPQLTDAENALQSAWTQVLTAAVTAGKSTSDEDSSDYLGLIAAMDGLEAAVDANRQAARAVDRELEQALTEVDTAYHAVTDATVALESAKTAAREAAAASARAVDSARTGVDNAQSAANRATSALDLQISSAEIRAPFTGLVSTLSASEGAVASGPLMTIVDDSELTITVDVKEADVARVREGQSVTFTTPATGAQEFSGTVRSISLVAGKAAAAPAPDGGEATSAAGKVSFPVEIVVRGNREGLRIGSTARTKIVVTKEPNVLAIPSDALLTDAEDSYSVLVVEADGTVSRRSVQVANPSAISPVITGGVNPGERILTRAEDRTHWEGRTITIDEAAEA